MTDYTELCHDLGEQVDTTPLREAKQEVMQDRVRNLLCKIPEIHRERASEDLLEIVKLYTEGVELDIDYILRTR